MIKLIVMLILLIGCSENKRVNKQPPVTPYKPPVEALPHNPNPLPKNCNEGFRTDFKAYDYNGYMITGFAQISENLINEVCYITIRVNNVKSCGNTVTGSIRVTNLAGSSRFITVTLNEDSCLFPQEFDLVYSFGHYYYDLLEIDFNGE